MADLDLFSKRISQNHEYFILQNQHNIAVVSAALIAVIFLGLLSFRASTSILTVMCLVVSILSMFHIVQVTLCDGFVISTYPMRSNSACFCFSYFYSNFKDRRFERLLCRSLTQFKLRMKKGKVEFVET